MNSPLAATLICLCCHTASFASGNAVTLTAAAETTATPPLTGIVATIAAEDAPRARRASVKAEAGQLYAQAPVDAPVAASAEKAPADDSNTLLMVGLALMAGIALRRWGAERS